MKILILGASGYLGARLYLDLKPEFQVVGTYFRTKLNKDLHFLDITDKKSVCDFFTQIKPDVIVQTANYPSPRFAKNNEQNYLKLNLQSTQTIKDCADKVGAKIIFVSSFAALNPDNIYGDLKLKSEKIISTTKSGFLVLRPSLILGYSPSQNNDRPFDRVTKCLQNPSLAVFDTSWKFQPTYIGHLSAVIKKVLQENIFEHLVHVFSPSIETQFSTARDILEPYGVKVKPLDKHLKLPLQVRKEVELTKLGLPTCGYQDMIDKIHGEIEEHLLARNET